MAIIAVEPEPMPTIHLEGTSKTSLADQYAKAADAVRAAIEAVHDAAPNGRDYYPQGEQAIGIALDAHRSRLDRLDAVLSQIEAIQIHISEQE